MQAADAQKAELLAAKIRCDVLEVLQHLGYGHLGGSLSIVEVLSVLYAKHMRYDPANPQWEDRDRLVLSKGHAGPALYAALAELGFFPRDMLFTLNEGNTHLPSHPDRLKTPGIDMTTGSLGQGTSTAAGMALALQKKKKDSRVFLIVGDGELNEGQCWEAFQFLAHYKLNRCVVIIDDNKKQLDGPTKEIINPFDIAQKMRAFGFYTLEAQGSDIHALDDALIQLESVEDQAVCLVLDSVKGAGVPFFEELLDNHSVKFQSDEINRATTQAICSLREKIAELQHTQMLASAEKGVCYE